MLQFQFRRLYSIQNPVLCRGIGHVFPPRRSQKQRQETGSIQLFFLRALCQMQRGLAIACKRPNYFVGAVSIRGLNLPGPVSVELWRARATEAGVSDRVQFLGRIANIEVRQKMKESDIVVVPSRHDYAEGLPNTLYEALASRTPTVISDHPAFASRLMNGENCLIFHAADPSSLAGQISNLLQEPTLYARLSARSASAHESLYVGMEWKDLVSAFLNDPKNWTGWVDANSLERLEEGPYGSNRSLRR